MYNISSFIKFENSITLNVLNKNRIIKNSNVTKKHKKSNFTFKNKIHKKYTLKCDLNETEAELHLDDDFLNAMNEVINLLYFRKKINYKTKKVSNQVIQIILDNNEKEANKLHEELNETKSYLLDLNDQKSLDFISVIQVKTQSLLIKFKLELKREC